jgi:hypothetical protein
MIAGPAGPGPDKSENLTILLHISEILAMMAAGSKPRLVRERGEGPVESDAKQKGGQIIENKRFHEIGRFRAPMKSRAYDPAAKRFVSFAKRLVSLLPV